MITHCDALYIDVHSQLIATICGLKENHITVFVLKYSIEQMSPPNKSLF